MKILCKTQVVDNISKLSNMRLADVLSPSQSVILGAVTDEHGALYLIFTVDDGMPDHPLTNEAPIFGIEEDKFKSKVEIEDEGKGKGKDKPWK